MAESQLIGYARRSNRGAALKLSIDAGAFDKAKRYKSSDGREFVSLVASADKIGQILEGQKEVTSLCQILDDE